MRRMTIVAVILVMLVASGCAPVKTIPEGEKEVYEWRMVTHQIEGTSRYDGTIIPFVEAVEELTDGQLIIEPYGSDILFPNSDSFDMVKNGVVEMGALYTGFWTGKDPVFTLGGGTDTCRSDYWFRRTFLSF
jgi:TRAP-type mannitol/chloroaromatic compound transport system substrate-binding protein